MGYMFVFSAREYGLEMVMIYGFSSTCLVPVGFCLCWGKTKGHIGDRLMTWRRHRLTWQVMASGEEIIPRQILICADGYPNKSVSGGLCGVWDAGLTLKEHFVFESSLCFTALPATKRYTVPIKNTLWGLWRDSKKLYGSSSPVVSVTLRMDTEHTAAEQT